MRTFAMTLLALAGAASLCLAQTSSETEAVSIDQGRQSQTLTMSGCLGGGGEDQPFAISSPRIANPQEALAGPTDMTDESLGSVEAIGTTGSMGSGAMAGTTGVALGSTAAPAYQLVGPEMAAYVGQTVEVTGTPIGITAGARQFQVESFKVIPGTCPGW